MLSLLHVCLCMSEFVFVFVCRIFHNWLRPVTPCGERFHLLWLLFISHLVFFFIIFFFVCLFGSISINLGAPCSRKLSMAAYALSQHWLIARQPLKTAVFPAHILTGIKRDAEIVAHISKAQGQKEREASCQVLQHLYCELCLGNEVVHNGKGVRSLIGGMGE